MIRPLAILLLGLASCHQFEKRSQSPKSDVVDSAIPAMTPSVDKRYGFDEIYNQYMSQDLVSYMENTHPTWSVPNQNRWYPQLFNKYKTNISLVNYVRGDFDGNGLTDAALIVDKGNNLLAAVAFLRGDSSFKTVELTEFKPEGDKIDFLLTLYKPGRYPITDPDLAPSDKKQVDLHYSSIGIGMFKELYEGGNDVYYWYRNQLRSCMIEK